MDIKKDGGPAFPHLIDSMGASTYPGEQKVIHETTHGCYKGMTLRDYFAGKAMQTLAAYEEYPPERAAERAYEYADEMLRAREEG